MKITAPNYGPPTQPEETEAWCTGKLYIPADDFVTGDFRNPFLCISMPYDVLVRLSDGMMAFETSSQKRGRWVDATDKFELIHEDRV